MHSKTLLVGSAMMARMAFMTLCLAPSPSRGMQLYLPFDEVVKQADAIFLGNVFHQQCRYGPNKNMIFTDVYFEVQKVIYVSGTCQSISGSDVMLTFAGGEMDGEIISVSDVPTFETGKTYLVLTRMDGKTYASPIIGGSQGLFHVVTDEVTRVSYPLTYGHTPIVEIKDHDIVTAPAIRTICEGALEKAESSMAVRRNTEAPRPAPWMGEARGFAVPETSAMPSKVMTLDEFITEIQKRVQ